MGSGFKGSAVSHFPRRRSLKGEEPAWLFCDEATSNPDDSSQACIYRLLSSQLPDIAIVTVAGREELALHHTRRWELRGVDGGVHELREIGPRPA